MEKKLLSIIVPVYNAEKYLKKCVDSLLGQTYRSLEVILVNDGSRDASLDLCYAFASEDNRVKVYDKPNGGAASARNLGLEKASGDYIGFCDADDFFDTDAFETLIGVMEERNLPTIEFLAKTLNSNYEVLSEEVSDRRITEKPSEELIREIFLRRGKVSLSTRVTRAEYIKDIRIPEGRRVEDFYFTILLLTRLEKTVVYNYPFYNFLATEGSVTRSGGGSIYFDAIYFFDKAREFLGDDNKKFEVEQQYYLYKIYYLLAISLTAKERRQFADEIKQIKRLIHQNMRLVKSNPYLKKKEKVIVMLAKNSFSFARFLYLMKNWR